MNYLASSLRMRVLHSHLLITCMESSLLDFPSLMQGISVRVRRPSDYNPSMAATLGPSQPSGHLNLAAVGLTPGCMSISTPCTLLSLFECSLSNPFFYRPFLLGLPAVSWNQNRSEINLLKFRGHFGVISSLFVCIYYILTWQLLLSRASGGADGPDRIFVGGLPYYLSEEQIMDLLSSFGWVKLLQLVFHLRSLS
jgi:hypothetical protein